MPDRTKVVFVIDDDPAMLKSLASLLNNLGFVTDVYTSAEAFLSGAKLSRATKSCLVLDIQLGGMSGLELGNRLVSTGQALPLIFITGNDSERLRNAALQQGCVAYLTKPCRPKLLVAAIERALS